MGLFPKFRYTSWKFFLVWGLILLILSGLCYFAKQEQRQLSIQRLNYKYLLGGSGLDQRNDTNLGIKESSLNVIPGNIQVEMMNKEGNVEAGISPVVGKEPVPLASVEGGQVSDNGGTQVVNDQVGSSTAEKVNEIPLTSVNQDLESPNPILPSPNQVLPNADLKETLPGEAQTKPEGSEGLAPNLAESTTGDKAGEAVAETLETKSAQISQDKESPGPIAAQPPAGEGGPNASQVSPSDSKVPPPFLQKEPSKEQYTNLMNVDPPKYLPNYRNPCWIESIGSESPYTKGYYYNADTMYKEFSKRIEEHWSFRKEQGQTTRMRCLPFFYVAGFPRCGTGDMYRNLMKHHQVANMMSNELHWWSKRRMGRLSDDEFVPISNYVDMFDDASYVIGAVHSKLANGTEFHPMVVADSSVSTLWFNYDFKSLPENTGRELPKFYNFDYISHVTPQARYIIMLRNPVDRMYSHYLSYQMDKERTPETFHNYAQAGINNFNKCRETNQLMKCLTDPNEKMGWTVLRAGVYEPYISRLLQVVPRRQLLVARLEDYRVDKVRVLNRIYNFFGMKTGLVKEEAAKIREDTTVFNRRAPDQRKKGDMLPKTRALLKEFYALYNERLAKLLNNDVYLWKGPNA